MASSAKRRTKGSKASDGKRKRKHSGSDEDGPAFLSSKYAEPPTSKIYNSRFLTNAPAELFRKDLISAMKLPDSEQLTTDEYWLIEDPWKPEWEKGVQVPVYPEALPEPSLRIIRKKSKEANFKLPKKLIRFTRDAFFNPEMHVMSYTNTLAERTCRYDMDDVDIQWLRLINEDREDFGLLPLEENVFEQVIEEFEAQAYVNFQEAIKSEAGLGLEYDEDAICDVCRSPDSQEDNEMVFCDSCNICVHQICYGITKIPEGSWICRTCALGIRPACVLCPNRGGAMKTTRCGQKWAHVSCAVWIPEVSFLNFVKMEPIVKITHIPATRWALVCILCKEKNGACIQCAEKGCKSSFHVTCAFKEGLKMNATIRPNMTEDDLLKAFCSKHSRRKHLMFSDSEGENEPKKKTEKEGRELLSSEQRANLRQQKIQEKEAQFYNYVNLGDVAELFQFDRTEIEIIFNYWKLKRKANWNRALLPPKIDTENECSEENAPFAFLKKLVHHRQDLERARNLCYMTMRREKSTKQWVQIKEKIFEKQVGVLTKYGVNLSEDEISAVQNANVGDLAYDKKYTGMNAPSPNMVSVLTNLVGEDITKPQFNGNNVKMSRKNDRTKCENPYAKFYLNGLAKRSQRFFQVDKRKKVSNLQSNSFVDDKSNPNFSFQSASDHFVSDDGLELHKDLDDLNRSFMSENEIKYESESTCDETNTSNLNAYSSIKNESLDSDIENKRSSIEIKAESQCAPVVQSPKASNTYLPSLNISEENISFEKKSENFPVKIEPVNSNTEYDKSSEFEKVKKEPIVKEEESTAKCTSENDSSSFNAAEVVTCKNEENSLDTSALTINVKAESNLSINNDTSGRKIKVEVDAKLNSPVCVLVDSNVPLLALKTGKLKIESKTMEGFKNSNIKNDPIISNCNNSSVENINTKKTSIKDCSLNKDKMDPKVCLVPYKGSVRTQSPLPLSTTENVSKLSPKHNQYQHSSKSSKQKPKNINTSHPAAPLSVNKQHPSSPSTKCQDKNPFSKADPPEEQQKGNSDGKEKVQEVQVPKKDTLRGYKIPKKPRTDKPEENSLDLKRGNSPLSPLPDITSTSLSSYHAKGKSSWRKLEPRTTKAVPSNSRTNLNGDVHNQDAERIVIKLKKDTSNPELQHWKSDSNAFLRGGMPCGWIGEFQSMPPPMLHPPFPPRPIGGGPWPRMRPRGGFPRIPMNYHGSTYT
ncbi:PHD finger protein rhinoceros-like [Uloborus diversus]|uniref:PHD finger protein rhinoceros-like n=1 Tax=Uloborus diversus TaxID=327109 RepID=UPI00240A1262|nr:PHD finger protein rhinoceros-like [Uloborus diversus]